MTKCFDPESLENTVQSGKEFTEYETIRKSTLKRFSVSIDWDWKFFAITPAFNINLHSKTFEFEWLFLGIYID